MNWRTTTARKAQLHTGSFAVPTALGTRLLLFISLAIALTAILQGLLAYRNALEQTDLLFDRQMQQTAYALRAGLPIDAKGLEPNPSMADESQDLIVQVWTNEGLRIFESAFGSSLPQMAVLGFSDVPARGTTYRVFSLQTRSQVIQVAQDLRVRREMARDTAWRSLLPIALLAPLLALAVWWVIKQSLHPVKRLREHIAQRKPQEFTALDLSALPDEIRPLVEEFNALLVRVQKAFEAQQHFIADAAHELRTPLSALQLQLQLLQRANSASERQHAEQRLALGIERASRLVQQLLTMARTQAQDTEPSSGSPQKIQEVDLSALTIEAITDLAPAALNKQLDLGIKEGMEQQAHLRVPGDPVALRSLVSNLLENCVKYVPVGGRIDVSWQQDKNNCLFVIEDSGPGIAPAERERVLQRFVRGNNPNSQNDDMPATGSGLGLAIAQTIAKNHGAQLLLDTSPTLGGLRVQLTWPPTQQ